uniref:Uncharacterized protein n=1 Tax=Panagrolaimus davidi TaxID=227884 RepID=A0A914Q2C9_9BILA
MLWSMILFFLLAATFNTLVDSTQSNYYKKIVIEYNGHKYINPYAFSEMNFTLETLDPQNFNFTARKDGRELIPISMNMSTGSSLTKVLCTAYENRLVCKTSTASNDLVVYELSLKDELIKLYDNYIANRLNFLQLGSKFLLKFSSTFTPAYDTIHCPFLMEWQPSVNLQEPTENVPKAVIPPNYDVCEESCDSLKNETGVKFGSKGTVEFTMALLDKEKEFKLLHSFGYFSPVFTIKSSDSCTKYTTKVTFNKESLTFTRDGEKIDIETDFKPLPESLKGVSISNASNVNFYFYGNIVYCTFFDPQNVFQLRLLKLPQKIAESMKSETTIKIGHTSSVNECNETLKLLVGNGVKLMFPKSDAPNSTVEPINSTLPANTNETTNATTSKPANKTEDASFPLWATILIGW